MELGTGVTQKTIELHTDFSLEAAAMKEHYYCSEQGRREKKSVQTFTSEKME